jgi:hypothetical protein
MQKRQAPATRPVSTQKTSGKTNLPALAKPTKQVIKPGFLSGLSEKYEEKRSSGADWIPFMKLDMLTMKDEWFNINRIVFYPPDQNDEYNKNGKYVVTVSFLEPSMSYTIKVKGKDGIEKKILATEPTSFGLIQLAWNEYRESVFNELTQALGMNLDFSKPSPDPAYGPCHLVVYGKMYAIEDCVVDIEDEADIAGADAFPFEP